MLVRDALRLNPNIVYWAGKTNLANAPRNGLDYARAPEGLCAVTVFTAHCNAMFGHQQLSTAAIQEYQIFEEVPPNSQLNLIWQSLVGDCTTKEAKTIFGHFGGFPT